ncbi:C5-cytosine methyltransferase [Haloarcula virus HCTV-16]|nr:C5-cytosine methyltransferase [Haloarcula virus HCTV-16]
MSGESPTVVSLFSGCGGLDLGFERTEADVVFATDYWNPAAETYQNNFENTRFLETDIHNISRKRLMGELGSLGYSFEDIDIVVGGPPCEGFSRLNNEQIQLDEMEKDRRNTLFEEFLRVVSVLEPQLVLMENVRDLMNRETSDGDLVKDLIADEFNAAGYRCRSEVLYAEEYGVPQERRRVFFIGTNRDTPIRFPRPTTPMTPKTVGEALDPDMDNLPNMTRSDTSEDVLEKIRHIPPGGYYRDLPEKYKVKEYQCGCENTETCEHDPEVLKRYGTYLRRLDPDEPSLTVSTNVFIHPTEDRYLTPREMARLQTFPDDFAFEGTKTDVLKQIGNAVPAKLGEEIANEVLKKYPEIRERQRVEIQRQEGETQDVLSY